MEQKFLDVWEGLLCHLNFSNLTDTEHFAGVWTGPLMNLYFLLVTVKNELYETWHLLLTSNTYVGILKHGS